AEREQQGAREGDDQPRRQPERRHEYAGETGQVRRQAERAAPPDRPVSEGDRHGRQQHPEKVGVPLDPLARVEDETVPLDQVAAVGEGEKRAVAGVGAKPQRRERARQQEDAPCDEEDAARWLTTLTPSAGEISPARTAKRTSPATSWMSSRSISRRR